MGLMQDTTLNECPFENDECVDYDCADCENERALQDDYDAAA